MLLGKLGMDLYDSEFRTVTLPEIIVTGPAKLFDGMVSNLNYCGTLGAFYTTKCLVTYLLPPQKLSRDNSDPTRVTFPLLLVRGSRITSPNAVLP